MHAKILKSEEVPDGNESQYQDEKVIQVHDFEGAKWRGRDHLAKVQQDHD